MRKPQIARRFERALASYDSNAVMQQEIALTLAKEIAEVSVGDHPNRVLEIGCGTGLFTDRYLPLLTIGQLYLNDIVESAVVRLSERLTLSFASTHSFDIIPHAEDVESCSFPSDLDFILSASSLQWIDDKETLFAKCAAGLRDGGYFIFNTFGPDNFREIKQLTGIGLHYPSAEQLIAQLSPHFTIESTHCVERKQRFDSPLLVLRHIRDTGVAIGCEQPWTKRALQTFSDSYRQMFQPDEQVAITWDILYFVCRKKGRI